MLESGELHVDGNELVALLSAVENGYVDITAASRSSIGCSRMTALMLLSRFDSRDPNTSNDSSAANA
jgi:hypothetical protein